MIAMQECEQQHMGIQLIIPYGSARTCGFLVHSQEQKRQVDREDYAISINYPAEDVDYSCFCFLLCSLFFVLLQLPSFEITAQKPDRWKQ